MSQTDFLNLKESYFYLLIIKGSFKIVFYFHCILSHFIHKPGKILLYTLNFFTKSEDADILSKNNSRNKFSFLQFRNKFEGSFSELFSQSVSVLLISGKRVIVKKMTEIIKPVFF